MNNGQFCYMAKDINIFGEVIPFDLGWKDYVCCADVDRQLEAAKGEDIIVNINSIGGDVAEGFMIYTSLRRYAEQHKAHVTTYMKGRCYSIATVIFLSGDKRVANKFLSPFVHNAWMYTMGDSKQLQRDADDLEKVNKTIAEFYAEHTELTYEEARAWMDADTFIDPEECVTIRFATEVENVIRPAALRKTLNKINNMSVNNKNEKSLKNKILNFFNSLEGGASNLEVFTSTNVSIIFPELEDGDEPKVGDKAEIDGKPAEGEYLMASGDTYVFVAGSLDEIRESEEEAGEQTMEELQAENTKLKEQLAAQDSLKQEVQDLKEKNAALNKNFSDLKKLATEYTVDTADNEDKDKESGKRNSANPLAASIANMKKK